MQQRQEERELSLGGTGVIKKNDEAGHRDGQS